MRRLALTAVLQLAVSICVLAQSPTATLSGRVLDPTQAAISGASVAAVNMGTNAVSHARTNDEGFYTIVNLPPGSYRVEVTKPGFKALIRPDLVLHVQDVIAINFKLSVGAVSESITVESGALPVNTESAAVSTVVDRNFADNIPLNGRSFQSLIELAPGVVPATGTPGDGGQFNVNGQRASANYLTVDGVSANIGIAAQPQVGNGLGGSLGSFSASGGTNSLVSVDALQEFRIQTSTYAPEFGRTPGGQISIVTRSGTNRFHGSLFDYFRNEVLDANDWFNGFTNNPPLPKAAERQNDFGGTLEGPIFKNRTFFFFSYEGLRLRLPRVHSTTVPCDSSCTVSGDVRAQAVPAMQPFFNAFPLPNGPEVFVPCDPITDPTCPPSGQQPTGSAEFNASYSDPSTLDAYSIRIDHKINDRLFLFGRYNLSPSRSVERGGGGVGGLSLSLLNPSDIRTETETVGATFVPSAVVTNDLRFNFSKTEANSSWALDHFGGAVPLASLPFPSPYNARDSQLTVFIFGLSAPVISVGKNARNVQRQFNIVDNLSLQRGAHSLKFGADYRRLSPIVSPLAYEQLAYFSSVSSASVGNADIGATIGRGIDATFLFRNLGLFVQDTWRIVPRLTMTYGVRWDVDFVPSTLSGPKLPAVTGFNLNDLSNLALAPVGTPPFKTGYRNLAPRLGLAYQLSQAADWGTTIRGGFGVFYDLATSEAGNNVISGSYPFGAFKFCPGVPGCLTNTAFPLDPSAAAPPPISPDNVSSGDILGAFDPHLHLPYTLQWNSAVEQGLGRQQSVSVSYVGSAGRRLIQSALVFGANLNVPNANLVTNGATSDYNALQFQFQRRMSHGLQSLVSYTWAHSIDTASAGSVLFSYSNALVPGNANRGPSDFDIRNGLSAAITYDVPTFKTNRLVDQIVRTWSLQSIIHVQSASPVNVFESPNSFPPQLKIFSAQVRPDVVPGIPLYLHGSQYPGGRAFNGTPGAVTGGCPDGSPSVGPFCPPPVGPDGLPTRQGNLGRNALRGFGLAQWDFSVHRDFAIHESLKLQFRAEMFNVLNHPNFGPPSGCLGPCLDPFGVSSHSLAQSLGANVGFGGFASLYQLGGPRSIQLALKLSF
jgi:hypothetical protein